MLAAQADTDPKDAIKLSVKRLLAPIRDRCAFIADMFNAFNLVGLGDPDTDLADGPGSFGVIFDPAHGGRIIQLALRLNF